MKERIQHIVKAESLTNLQFAQLLDISPAAVTHLLAGRNKPSLDIVVKIASKLPHYNLRWLLLGEGTTYNHAANVAQNGDRPRDLFATPEPVIRNQSPIPAKSLTDTPHAQTSPAESAGASTQAPSEQTNASIQASTGRTDAGADGSISATAPATPAPEQQKLIVCLPDGTYQEFVKK